MRTERKDIEDRVDVLLDLLNDALHVAQSIGGEALSAVNSAIGRVEDVRRNLDRSGVSIYDRGMSDRRPMVAKGAHGVYNGR